MSESTNILPAIIGFLGVLAGGTVIFLGNSFIAKKNLKKEISLKMAEYRLQWINNLGNEIADFSSAISIFMASQDDKELQIAHRDVFRSFSKIQLLMNSKDEDFYQLKTHMEDLIENAGNHQGKKSESEISASIKVFHHLNGKFIGVSNKILKREWRKLKKNIRDDTLQVSALKSDSEKTWIKRQAFPDE